MVAGTAEVTMVRCSLLFAMIGLTLLSMREASSADGGHEPVDPHPVHVDQGFNVLGWPIAPSRSVPSGWWKRPVFRWPCRQQSSAWRDRVPDGSASFTSHSRQGARKRTGETAPSCRAIRAGTAVSRFPVGERLIWNRGIQASIDQKRRGTPGTHACHIRRSILLQFFCRPLAALNYLGGSNLDHF